MQLHKWHSWRGFAPGLLLVLALLSGCATQTRSLLQSPAATSLPRHIELVATPFFPQERYQCGPAALAMSLNAAGVKITPDALVPQVYVPQREGSLQPEMLAAARRNGVVSMTIPPRLESLLAELAAGNPVIVLQNLSLPLFPLWHYAVAIGYDLDKGDIILRSGTTAREVMPLSTFEHTWARGNYWGEVVLQPGRMPMTVDEQTATEELVAFEKNNEPSRARKAYASALKRWPHNLTLQMGYGNTAYASGDRVAAADAFRSAARDHPDSGAAFNNLATVLAELGRFEEARNAAEKAVALDGPWRDDARATLRAIETRKSKAK
ncbi:MAG TPA: PA2778 family cysteine peptidase [Noviherbaspirillum sp.]|uniref:PA2778 family cysteine peptidase n=1 Tax=Noviherbaspirillum sp. TaxID=1926288 RepID=UPI002B4889A9|nr:PA2778 family cysteine peptidase [Noviherbaspirillum sp.]HJV86528.1 PA2778 family cysteine peptidase [Noviherbaspirillum sp.]